MNKAIIREVLRSGIKLKSDHFVFNSRKIGINEFLIEVTKANFTHSIHESVELCKSKLFLDKTQKQEDENEY